MYKSGPAGYKIMGIDTNKARREKNIDASSVEGEEEKARERH